MKQLQASKITAEVRDTLMNRMLALGASDNRISKISILQTLKQEFPQLTVNQIKYAWRQLQDKHQIVRQRNQRYSARRCSVCHDEFMPYSSHTLTCDTCTPDTVAKLRWRKYGITQSQFNTLLIEQAGKCRLCDIDIKQHSPWLDDRLVVDHDHVTGAVRSLLCQRCNRALGFIENRPTDWLKRATLYLEEMKDRNQ